MKLLKRLLNKDVRAERRFLKGAYGDANSAIFATRLNAATTRRVREGIRRDLDTVKARIKATGEAIEELFVKLEIDPEKRGELEKAADILPAEDLIGLNDEARDKAIKDAAKRTREMRASWVKDKTKKMIEKKHGDERKDEEERVGKVIVKILQLVEAKQDTETSAEQMSNQMRGKWSVGSQQYEAGIDQRLNEIGRQVAGGEEVKRVIKGLLKRL